MDWGVWKQEWGRNQVGISRGGEKTGNKQKTGLEVFGYKSAFPRDPPHQDTIHRTRPVQPQIML